MKATPNGMEEVLALESLLRGSKDKEARAILSGKFPATGTRLDALKEISKRLKLTVDV